MNHCQLAMTLSYTYNCLEKSKKINHPQTKMLLHPKHYYVGLTPYCQDLVKQLCQAAGNRHRPDFRGMPCSQLFWKWCSAPNFWKIGRFCKQVEQ